MKLYDDFQVLPHSYVAVVTVLLFGPLFAAEDSSQVFVYSQRDSAARSWVPVERDGETIAEIKRGFFFAVGLRPGRHSFAVRDGVPVSFEVQPDSETFIRLDWSHDVRRSAIPVLSIVPAEVARREMRFLSYIEGNRVHSGAVSREERRPADRPRFRTR